MKWLLLVASFGLSSAAFAGDETRTMPKGIFGIRINNVFVTGTDYEFDKNGNLGTIGEIHQSSLNDQISHFNSGDIKGNTIGDLVAKQILDMIQGSPTGQALIQSSLNSMDLGYMRVNVTPSTQVTSPTVMYGVTNRWNMILNVPFVRMSTKVKWEYIPGSSTATINSIAAAGSALGLNIPNSSQFADLGQAAVTQKGYKPMVSNSKSFVGDAYFMNLFDLGRIGRYGFGTMNTLSLPTGPSHDPDDLLDSGAFHHAFIEQEVTMTYQFTHKLSSYVSGSVRYNLPEETRWRVPANEFDQDPDASQTATITRQIGFGTVIEGGFKYRVAERFGTKLGAAQTTKAGDKFSGDKVGDYSAIEKSYPYNASKAFIAKAAVVYDPLSNYKPGSIPLMVDLAYEQTIAGTNAPAIKQVMLSFSTFF